MWATPALLVGLVGLHLFIFRHNGAAGPPTDKMPTKVGRFYPDQIFMDTVIAFLVFIVIVALSWYLPAPLLAIALCLIYYDARVRKEGFDLQRMLDALPPPAGGAPPAPAVS